MKDQLIQSYYRLLEKVSLEKHRGFFADFVLTSRLVGLVGARGTGKTTIMLQYIKEKIADPHTALYFSADHIFFTEQSLLSFIEEQYSREGRRFFFIDEVHKYPRWNQELKNVYDSFPDITVLFSGSSSLDLITGSYDLSRRAILHHLPGMSFREYLNFETGLIQEPFSLDQIIESHQSISMKLAEIPRLLGHFHDYLKNGYYPFYFEDRTTFPERLLSVIEKTIYEDIASYYSLRTENLPLLKKMIAFFATIQPGEISVNGIAKALGIDNKTAGNYIEMLSSTGLLRTVGVDKSGASLVRTPDKVFLNNTAMYFAVSGNLGIENRIGTVRECFFLSMIQNAGKKAFYSKAGDYTVNDFCFEIGGKSKGYSQIKDVPNSFLIKDDILVSGGRREIPLWLLGFLY